MIGVVVTLAVAVGWAVAVAVLATAEPRWWRDRAECRRLDREAARRAAAARALHPSSRRETARWN